jgi:hypothetical protein
MNKTNLEVLIDLLMTHHIDAAAIVEDALEQAEHEYSIIGETNPDIDCAQECLDRLNDFRYLSNEIKRSHNLPPGTTT